MLPLIPAKILLRMGKIDQRKNRVFIFNDKSMKNLNKYRNLLGLAVFIALIALFSIYGADANIQTLNEHGRVDTSQGGRLIYYDSDNFKSLEEQDALNNLKDDYHVFYLPYKYDY